MQQRPPWGEGASAVGAHKACSCHHGYFVHAPCAGVEMPEWGEGMSYPELLVVSASSRVHTIWGALMWDTKRVHFLPTHHLHLHDSRSALSLINTLVFIFIIWKVWLVCIQSGIQR